MISTRFLEDTACPILSHASAFYVSVHCSGHDILGSKSLIVHEKKVNIAWVLNEEGFVAGWHHVASLLVGAEPNLDFTIQRSAIVDFALSYPVIDRFRCKASISLTYPWHGHLTFEPSPYAVINAFRLPPACIDTFVEIALVPVETFPV